MNDKFIYKFKAFCFQSIQIKEGNKAPKARSGHRIVSTDSNVYSFGGYNHMIDDSDPEYESDADWLTTRPLFRELWRFSLITKEWTRLETSGQPPDQLASHCATLIGDNNLIVFGGTGFPFGFTSSNRLHVCNLRTNEWNGIQSNNIEITDCPHELYGQGFTTDHLNDIYTVGGTDGFHYSIDVHKFELKSRLWHHLYRKSPQNYGDFPEERYRHEVVFYDNKLYVFGGGTSLECHSLVVIPVFDIHSRVWLQIETKNDGNALNDNNNGYPKDRRCHDCVRIESNVFLMGGTDGLEIFDDLWRLDLNSNQWTKINTRIPKAVCFQSASVSATGQLSLFGGVTNINHKERTNDVYTIWLKVPALKEMAFNAVLHYIQTNKTKTNNSLKEIFFDLRLPLNFIQRLS